MKPRLVRIVIKTDDSGRVRSVFAKYAGLPLFTRVRLELIRVGAKTGSVIAEGVSDRDGELTISSGVMMIAGNFWTHDPIALRLIGVDKEGFYEVFHVRPQSITGWRYWLWWLNPVHWLEYYILDSSLYWINQGRQRLS